MSPPALRDISIGIKLFAIMALLGLTAALAGWSGMHALHVYRTEVTAMRRASEQAIIAEQVNGLINAVVMDSRGIYMAKSTPETQKFAAPLLANLKRIQDRTARWSQLVGPDEAALLQECLTQVRGFITLRTELVDVGLREGAAAAGIIGNNDANRSNREALNVAVVALARRNAAEIPRLADEMAAFEQTMSTVLPSITAAGIAIVAVLAGFLVIGGIVRPLSRIADAMRLLADGVLDVELASNGGRDEIGRMTMALEIFRTQSLDNQRLTAAREKERIEAAEQKRQALMHMAETIETAASLAIVSITTQSDTLAATAGEMRARAERTGESARAAAAASARGLANAQVVAAAAEELTASIREISGQVDQSTEIVARAVDAGTEARSTIDALTERVNRIGSIADMINNIAANTNLLALNATIEAARAGEAGKGFAVVASEVKLLAKQTARSTEEIARQVAEVQASTAAAVQAVLRIGSRIHEITAISGAIAAAIAQQGSATSEIARNVVETASATNEITDRNAEVSSEAALGGQQAEAVLISSRGLGAAVGELRTAVVRAVRGSSDDVNRRDAERFELDLTGRMEIDGQTECQLQIVDLSQTGARVKGNFTLPQGSKGRLWIDRLGKPLDFSVAGNSTGEARLRFAENQPDATAAVREFLADAASRQAA